MTKFIRKYQRWALAFFGVLLMLTFLGNRGNGGGTDTSDRVLGHLDGKPVTRADVEESRNELSLAERHLAIPDPSSYRQISLVGRLFGQQTFNDFTEKPVLFFLLRQEARKSGVPMPAAELDQIMTQCYQGSTADTDEYNATRSALADLFLILGQFQRLQNDIKISRPALDHLLAGQRESIGVNFVQLQAADYLPKVTAPTTQQVQDQFQKFADTIAGPSAILPGSNPFGFGYKFPVRAQVQTLSVSPKSVEDAVIAAGPQDVRRPDGWSMDLWWDLAGKKYYQAHLGDYEQTPRTSTTQPAGPLPVKTYAAVRDEVLSTIRRPAIDKLTDTVKSFLNTNLVAGWQTYRDYLNASPTPTTEPATKTGQPYTSFQFLQSIANQAFSKFNVIVIAHDDGKPLPLPPPPQQEPQPTDAINSFVITQAKKFVAADTRSSAALVELTRPSPPLQSDSFEPVQVVRVIRVLPATAPTDIAQVRPLVEADVRQTAAYSLAKADADALLVAANKGTLAPAAFALGHPMLSTNPANPLSLVPADDPKLDPTNVIFPPLGPLKKDFLVPSFDLLGKFDPKANPNPAKLVELQPQARLFVVQLNHVTADWNAENYYKTVMQICRDATQRRLPRLHDIWFNYDNVVKRTGYIPVK